MSTPRSLIPRLAALGIGVALALAMLASPAAARIKLKKVGRFDQPTYVTQAPGTPGILVVEKAGRVISMQGRQRHTFLDISSLVRAEGEEGLLSLAFPPGYHGSGLFYAYYTNTSGDIVIAEFHATGATADPASRRQVLLVPHPGATNHDGGQLQFGPDGLLYIGTGDGGNEGDPNDNGQSTNTLLGKILRINPRPIGSAAYSSPASNPFASGPGRDEIFAYGLRNPYRFSFDGERLAIADVGQDRFEELDYNTLAQANGANFGWNDFEGFAPFSGAHPPIASNTTKPIFAYSHSGGRCAIVGGYVVHNPKLGALNGRYVYGDFCDGVIRSLVPQLGGARKLRKVHVHRVHNLSSFGVSTGGALFAASLDGPVYRFKRGG